MTAKEAREHLNIQVKNYKDSLPKNIDSYIKERLIPQIKEAVSLCKDHINLPIFSLDFDFTDEISRQLNSLGYHIIINTSSTSMKICW